MAIRALTLFLSVFEWSKTLLFSSAIQSTKDSHIPNSLVQFTVNFVI